MASTSFPAIPANPGASPAGLPERLDCFISLKKNWAITYCDAATLRRISLRDPELKWVGRKVWDCFPVLLGTPAEQSLRRAMAEQQPESFEYFVDAWQRWVEVRLAPSPEGLAVFVRERIPDVHQPTPADLTLSHLTDMAYSFDPDGRFTYANRRTLEVFGLTLEQVIGRRVVDVHIPAELARQLQAQIAEVVRSRKLVQYEAALPSASGVIQQHEYIFNPILNPEGAVIGVAGSARCVTARKRVQATGEAQRRVLQYMAENRPLPEVLDALVRMVELQSDCPMFASILLFDESGKCLRHGAAPSLPAEFNRQIDGFLVGPLQGACGSAAYFKKPVATADISTDPRWAGAKDLVIAHGLRACWSMPILSNEGNVLGTFAQYYTEPKQPGKGDWRVLETATRTAALAIDRKRVEAALRQSEARFRRLSDSAPVPIWITDANKACTWANKPFLEFTGRTLEQVAGRAFEVIVHHDDLVSCMEEFDRCFDARREFEVECRVRRRDGCWRWWLNRGIPLYGPNNEFTGYIGSCVDITEKREVQAELERLVTQRTAKLTETNAQLETLVYSIAHDLRAPLRSLQSFSDLLLEEHGGEVSEGARMYAKRIARAAGLMDALVTDLLAYGRVARSELVLTRVQVLPAVKAALAQFEADIATRGARMDVPGSFPAVQAHEGMLVQVLANLLGNALKFVPPGRVPHVVFRWEPFGQMVRLWIEDNGIGIAAHHHERIFRVFERLHGREYGGTGIGLSIVRKGVERMGGRVGVISSEGSGARFWIELARA